ncbi:MAG: YfhO family protein [Chloroflexota bacterium]
MKLRPTLTVLLGCLLWLAPLLPNPQEVLFWRGGEFSDLLISHWPNAAFLRRSLTEWGQIPLWNPMILSGAPFLADPLSGVWYPPMWLASLIAPGLAFNLLAYLHLVWAGLGAFQLARRMGVSDQAATLAGLAFSGSPKLVGHLGLGHISLVFAVSWTPWVLLAVDSAVRDLYLPAGRRLRTAALSGSIAGLVFLVDPRWYLPTLMVAVPFAVWRTAHSHAVEAGDLETGGDSADKIEGAETDEGSGAGLELGAASGRGLGRSFERRDLLSVWGKAVASLVTGGLFSIGIGAGLALPLAEFMRLSTRAELTLAEGGELSLPLNKIADVLAPDLAAWPEWQVYSGAVVLFLAVSAMLYDWRRSWFWAAAVAVMLVIGLGPATPLYPLLRNLVPGFAQLRVPPRGLFLAAFALVMLAGRGLHRITSEPLPAARIRWLAALLVGAVVVAGWVQALEAPSESRLTLWLPHLMSAGLIAMSAVWALAGQRGGGRPWPGWTVLILLDLGLVNLAAIEVRPGATLPDPRAQAISQELMGSPPGRAFSPSYSLPQPSAAGLNLELADGVNPLQLDNYYEFMTQATGFPASDYSVTLPPFPEGGPEGRWAVTVAAEKLGLLSISQLLSAYPIRPDGLEYEGEILGHSWYSNPSARPRAWVETSSELGWRVVKQIEWSPNRIRVVAEGSGHLVLSELAYPGWRVSIDGESAPIGTAEGLLRAVELPAGEHEAVFTFRPASLMVGLAISAIFMLLLASLWIAR